ncbi:hypothetical protein CPB83DRAFT_911308 [Crepidotus variabilis]|uniref:Uncharacterized protein n=1 Tax=Crepidotus variabilis TaxID=179855 RepID=A0A9P6E4S7_9AGAR|nr:hypothetical protein CPB83DRAFT_911308 [Crepidotus variabilis]
MPTLARNIFSVPPHAMGPRSNDLHTILGRDVPAPLVLPVSGSFSAANFAEDVIPPSLTSILEENDDAAALPLSSDTDMDFACNLSIVVLTARQSANIAIVNVGGLPWPGCAATPLPSVKLTLVAWIPSTLVAVFFFALTLLKFESALSRQSRGTRIGFLKQVNKFSPTLAVCVRDGCIYFFLAFGLTTHLGSSKGRRKEFNNTPLAIFVTHSATVHLDDEVQYALASSYL